MKKCDLHIHTVPTISDSAFTFSVDVLQDYVKQMELDVIAVTNHNVFDMSNYMAIRDQLPDVVVLPGIEVNLEGGHILVISNPEDVDVLDFGMRCDAVTREITTPTDDLTLDKFKSIFSDLSKYVLIPHYDKTPSLPRPVINRLSDYIFAGEVTSIKKFLYMQKDENEFLTPVIFSDFRCAEGKTLEDYPVRHTFLNVAEVNVRALNICLGIRSNASLTASDGNSLFEIFSDGQMLSTGLNIMYGKRSTGKTWTLNKIASKFGDRAKYIKQFELQNYGQPYTSEQFENEQKVMLEGYVTTYLKPFKDVVEDVVRMPERKDDEAEVDDYLKALLKRSDMENMNDVFSSSALYDEIPFSVGGTSQIRKVIDAVITLLDSNRYSEMVFKHISEDSLKNLLAELIEKLWSIENHIKCKSLANEILKDVKDSLQLRTALPAIPNIDIFEIAKRQAKRKKFVDIVNGLKKPRTIHSEKMQEFKIIVNTGTFANATDVKAGQGISASLVNAYYFYDDPLAYLHRLVDAGIDSSKLYKLFVKIKYKILNKNGFSVSGGERSEFRFIQKIKDARTKDILLIDEPESSFDNIFLKRDINKFIKEISKEMPVVVSTHNNTIGGSIDPDYILYTDKEENGHHVVFKLYSGLSSDKMLRTVDGEETNNYIVTLDSLEAGEEAYTERKNHYGVLKD